MGVTRRHFIIASGLGAASALSGCCFNPALPKDQNYNKQALFSFKPKTKKLIPIIDAHGHFFNATDMQAGGYLRNAVIPGLGIDTHPDILGLWTQLEKVIDRLANAIAPTTSEEWKFLDRISSTSIKNEASAVDILDDNIDIERIHIAEAIIDALGGEKGQFAQHFNRLVKPIRARGYNLEFSEEAIKELVLSDDIQSKYSLTNDASNESNSNKIYTSQSLQQVNAAIGTLMFLVRMLSKRCSNIRAYHKAFTAESNGRMTQTHQVVDALVDFDYWMGSKNHPCSRLRDQIILHERLNYLSGGYLIPLAGFNPFSAVKVGLNDYLSVIEDALKYRNFKGIKLYPPNGFSADGSVVDAELSNKNSLPKEKDIREALHEAYDLCLANNAVVMAHGNFSSGRTNEFKALAGPAHWKTLLTSPATEKKYNELKVNIGHFGGGPCGPQFNWSNEFLALMQKAPGLHADLGYHDELLDPNQVSSMQKLLKAKPKTVQGFDRVMYGTDWLMLERVEQWQKYADKLYANLGSGQEKLSKSALHAVFYGNAERFFNK